MGVNKKVEVNGIHVEINSLDILSRDTSFPDTNVDVQILDF